MSRRGGGRGKPTPPMESSPPVGGGRGGGGRGRGRGGGAARSSVPPTVSSPAVPPTVSAPPVTEVGSSSSSAAESLSHEVQQKLTIQAPSLVVNPPASSKALKFPARPGLGTVGMKCAVRANHFLVKLEEKDLHHYDVSINPEVISRGVNRAVMKQLVDEYGQSHLGKKKPVFDGRKSLYTAGALPFSSKEFVIKLKDKDETSGSARKEREFRVAIKFAARADLQHLLQFLRGRQMDSPQETIQVLDVVLRELPSNKYSVVGRSFFSPNLGQRREIGDGLECWRGYYQSLRPTQMGMSLNIDVSATSFYEPTNVVEYVAKFLNLRDVSRQLSDSDRAKVRKALKGVRVQVEYGNKKRHKISAITVQPTSKLMFPVDDQGKTMSVVQYYLDRYKIRLQYSSLPSLQAGSESRPVYLPMEVCTIVEGQRYARKLNEKQVTALLRETCQRPHERQRSIEGMVTRNKYNDDPYAKEFGINVTNNLTTIPGARVLPPPMLKYHDTGREVKIQPRVGQWNMINTKMVNGGTVDFWTCLNFSRLNQDAVQRFCQELVGMCASKGMVFNPRPLLPIRSARPDQIEPALVDVHTYSNSQLASSGVRGKQLQLLIIILPDASGSYGKIKRICETELGIVSQCCQPRQASKLNKQYLENVSLKINVKVGGRNTVLFDALLRKIPIVSEAPTIIFGADVTHPQPGEDSSPSIAAVVASMDWPEITKYRGLVSAQPHRQEMIQDLYKVVQDPERGLVHSGMIRELLIAFKRSTGHKPHRIIFYRDGVSEGQFNQVLLYELDAINKACASLEEGYLPPITFVVVQKRHHTRLFAADHGNRNLTDRSGNVLAGTVVDTMICHPSEFDFYLCSHAGIQGTSRPTHYHVLWDQNNFTADILQLLTNNLCYTYARCTRSVSIVPPAYYAHLAAFRARYYIEGDTSDGGSSRAGQGGSTRARTSVVRTLPQIKDCVKDVMFYC